jgi:hypothetical protein
MYYEYGRERRRGGGGGDDDEAILMSRTRILFVTKNHLKNKAKRNNLSLDFHTYLVCWQKTYNYRDLECPRKISSTKR